MKEQETPLYMEEFVSKDGLTFAISFDDHGHVESACVYIADLLCDIDCTAEVKTSPYFKDLISNFLAEQKLSANEVKYFKAYKDVM